MTSPSPRAPFPAGPFLHARNLAHWRATPELREAFELLGDVPVLLVAVSTEALPNTGGASDTNRFNEAQTPNADPVLASFKTDALDSQLEVFLLLKDPTLPYPDRVLLGRAPGNDVILAVPTVSRLQVTFNLNNDAWWMKDMGATNGTFLNGRRLRQQQHVALRSEDLLAFGPHTYALFLTNDAFRKMLRNSSTG